MVLDGRLDRFLRLRVERRADRQTASVPQLRPVLPGLAEDLVGQEDLAHVVAEEAGAVDRGDAAVLGLTGVQPERLPLGPVGLGLGDVPDLGHALQDGVAALGGLCLVVDRVVAARGLDDAGQQRGFLQVQVLGVLGEVALGGGLDTVGLLAEEGDVQVVLEDLLLAELLLDLDRVLQLADLAAQGLLGGLGDLRRVVAGLLDEVVLHQLLGERGGALGDPAALRVLVQGAQHALEVDRAVLVEARVLDRDDRLLHVRRNVLEVHHRTVAGVDGRDLVALAVQDGGALAELGALEVGRDLVEALDRALGREAQRAGRGQRDARHHGSREHTDTEELGGLLCCRQTTARALLWHGGSLIRTPERSDGATASRDVRVPDRDVRDAGDVRPGAFQGTPEECCRATARQSTVPTFSFAGHARRPWPKLLSTVTAVRPRINTSGDPESFWKYPDFLVGACPNPPRVLPGARCGAP